VINPFRFFAVGKEKPMIENPALVNKLYKKFRFQIMLAITVGNG